MKLIKSTIKRDKPIGELPHGKVTITMEGTDAESIWVAYETFDISLQCQLNKETILWES